MKKNLLNLVMSIISISVLYMLLSLACSSGPEPEPERKIRLDIATLNEWLINHEVKMQVTNGLTSKQLMEVTKLCLSSGELQNVSIVEENDVLSFAVLELKLKVEGVWLKCQYHYSISKSGVLTMRIKSIYEEKPDSFILNVNESSWSNVKQSMINNFEERLTNNGNIVINRSGDFA